MSSLHRPLESLDSEALGGGWMKLFINGKSRQRKAEDKKQ